MHVMYLIKVGFDCLSHLDTNVKDGYDCYEFDIGWVWLLSHLDTNFKDGYECYEFDIAWVWLFFSSGYKC